MKDQETAVSSGKLHDLLFRLQAEHALPRAAWLELLRGHTPALQAKTAELAFSVREKFYGNKVYLRGLVEFTSYCRNNCYYCGIRVDIRDCMRTVSRLWSDDIFPPADSRHGCRSNNSCSDSMR